MRGAAAHTRIKAEERDIQHAFMFLSNPNAQKPRSKIQQELIFTTMEGMAMALAGGADSQFIG